MTLNACSSHAQGCRLWEDVDPVCIWPCDKYSTAAPGFIDLHHAAMQHLQTDIDLSVIHCLARLMVRLDTSRSHTSSEMQHDECREACRSGQYGHDAEKAAVS